MASSPTAGRRGVHLAREFLLRVPHSAGMFTVDLAPSAYSYRASRLLPCCSEAPGIPPLCPFPAVLPLFQLLPSPPDGPSYQHSLLLTHSSGYPLSSG